MKKALLVLGMALMATTAMAQRFTDKLDRGLVAVPASSNGGSGSGNLVSWRIFGEEYYDVTYNLYANGSLLKSGLTVSNFNHTAGNATTKYQVAAVVRGVEQEKCAEVTRWNNGYLDITLAPVVDREGTDVTTAKNYQPNDVSLGDVTGDGVSELIVKRNNCVDIAKTANKTAFNFHECYDLSGNLLWKIDCGPNMMSEADEQYDVVAYDWDEDGRCELLMRGADNMRIYTADGDTIVVGSATSDTRWDDITFTSTGPEFLLYMDGRTARPFDLEARSTHEEGTHLYYYTPMDYPLPRYDAGEAQDEGSIWGAGIIGHRPTKHFFGAPFLDGRKASIFLGRGIYTRTKVVALDVNPATHELTERWRWHCYDSSSPWFGQGYHNFAIADVDWDGRDEIVYGSMVIDDNGRGLSTTGLGHGDAQHCGDLDPYRHGQEQFACNEYQPCMNFRNATTSEIYYRWVGSSDDGRAIAGNFTNAIPGSVGASIGSGGAISLTADKLVKESNSYINSLNFRIYWDGDLCDEQLDSPGTERDAAIYKNGSRIFLSSWCQMNNWSKNNPGAMGDIIGDWREEIVLRCNDGGSGTKLRIYTSPFTTSYRVYTLWHDHQYRQGMVWECMGYNQPPHVSYFLGQLEGITTPPPPLTNRDRTEVKNGATIGSSLNDQHVMLCETGDATVSISEGAAPYIFTDNAPSWVQGTDVDGTSTLANPSEIIHEYYTHTLTGAAFTGSMRLVKQGDGTLVLPAVEQTYTGSTDIWAGTLQFDGKLSNSELWLNRFAALNSDGGEFKSIAMEYDAKLRPGGADHIGSLKVGALKMGIGARIVFDMVSGAMDQIDVETLTIDKKTWNYGPKYLTPVIEIAADIEIADGTYELGSVQTISGSLSNIVIEGVPTSKKATLTLDEGKLTLTVETLRQAADIVWSGSESTSWDFAKSENFMKNGETTVFVMGDKVRFDDTASNTTVVINEELTADSIIIDASKNFTFNGNGAIVGSGALVKSGTGSLTINNENGFTGGVRLSGGTTIVTSMANSTQARSSLGAMTSNADQFIIENGAELRTTTPVNQESPIKLQGDEGGVVNKTSTFYMASTFEGTRLTLKGAGLMQSNTAWNKLDTLVIQAGNLQLIGHNRPAKAVILEGGTLIEGGLYVTATYPIIVPKSKSATYNLAERCAYTNKITGEGTLTVVCPPTNGGVARTAYAANLSAFEGTLKVQGGSNWGYFIFDNSSTMTNGTLQIVDNVEVKNSYKTMAIGQVKGDNGKLGGFEAAGARITEGYPTWKLGNDNNWSWGGILTGGCNLQKVGTGKATLSGASNHTGTTVINEGELHISTKTTLGTGTLTVKNGAILSGTTGTSGSLTNSAYTISSGGTLQVGSIATSTSGVISFGGKNLTMAKGSFLQLGINRAATATNTGGASIQSINRLTMNGTIQLHYSTTFAENIAVGDSVVLWKATTVTGTPVLESEVIDAERGLYWDTTDLKSGILRVTDVAPTAIRSVSVGDAKPIAIYSLGGIRMSQTDLDELYSGIYIVEYNVNGAIIRKKIRK